MADASTIPLSTLVLTTFSKGLDTLSHILHVAESHTQANDIDPNTEYLSARLIEDMRPLSFQIQNLTKHVRVVLARLTGEDFEVWEDSEKTFAEFYTRIEKARGVIERVEREFKGRIDERAGVVVDQYVLLFSSLFYLCLYLVFFFLSLSLFLLFSLFLMLLF